MLVAALEYGSPEGTQWPAPLKTADLCEALQDGLEDALIQTCVPALMMILYLPGRNDQDVEAMWNDLPSRAPEDGPTRTRVASWIGRGPLVSPMFYWCDRGPRPGYSRDSPSASGTSKCSLSGYSGYTWATFKGVLNMLLLETIASDTVTWFEIRKRVGQWKRAGVPWWERV